jgi:hypothetical protein
VSAETRIVCTPGNEESDKQSNAPAEFAESTGCHEKSTQSGQGQILKLEGMDDATASRGVTVRSDELRMLSNEPI